MEPISFPQQTDILAEKQPEYTPLPVRVTYETGIITDPESGEQKRVTLPWTMTAGFRLSAEEMAQVIKTGILWYTQSVMGNRFQPVHLSTLNPFEATEEPGVYSMPPKVEGWPDYLVNDIFLMLTAIAGTDRAAAALLYISQKLQPFIKTPNAYYPGVEHAQANGYPDPNSWEITHKDQNHI